MNVTDGISGNKRARPVIEDVCSHRQTEIIAYINAWYRGLLFSFPPKKNQIYSNRSSGLASPLPDPSRIAAIQWLTQVRRHYSSGGCGGIAPHFRSVYPIKIKRIFVWNTDFAKSYYHFKSRNSMSDKAILKINSR